MINLGNGEQSRAQQRQLKKRKRKKKRFKVFITIGTILVFILCLGGYAYSYLLRMHEPASAETNTSDSGVTEVSKGGIVNILVSGVDIGDTKVNVDEARRRTDTILLLSYNPKTDILNIVSIPRDTMVTIKGKAEKINASNVFGGKNYLNTTVSNLLGVDINYSARLNYAGFRKIIDAIGGIDMEITRNMYYDDASQNLHIYFRKGTTVHLDGKKAEEFFRWRQNNDGTGLADGDLGRIENQHLFIQKVIEKVKTPAIIAKIPAIMNIVADNVTTTMKPEEMVQYALKFAQLDSSKITMSTLKGTTPTINGVSYFVFDKNQNMELLAALHGEETTATQTAQATLERDSLNIEVLNGTLKNGLAAGYAANLKEKGYTKPIPVGNGTRTSSSKIILYGVDSTLVSQIKDEFGIKNVEIHDQKSGNFDIIVLLGEDYKSSLQ